MKTMLSMSLLMMALLFSGSYAQAQAQDDVKHNYVVLTKKIPQLKPILITAEKLKEEDGKSFGQFEIIICGQEIGDITDPSKVDEFISIAEGLGVKLIACGFSLNKFKVDRQAVPEEMEVVENGILYNFQLQKKDIKALGYRYGTNQKRSTYEIIKNNPHGCPWSAVYFCFINFV